LVYLRFMKTCALLAVLVAAAVECFATNPLITDQFTADPSARVFGGKMYVYPSHDIPPVAGKTRPDWFCMEDYHVFSSSDLNTWTDHGVIVSQANVPWVDATKYAMWAPDCVTKGGKYYFYFPAQPKAGGGFRIGVAVADKPEGPFTPEAEPIAGVQGIDPCAFIDRDGTAYLYFSRRVIVVAKLKESMKEIEGQPLVIDNLPKKGLLEGPFLFERNGIYYLTYPHVEVKTERLEYAMGSSPMGPFKPAGVIMDESPSGCWTNHQSIVEYRGQWYLFYHDKDLSPGFDKNRSIHADRLFFNDDGTIKKVVPTLRGVGVADAMRELQIDRYSATTGDVAVSFIDAAKPGAGWKIALSGDATVRFNEVDFGEGREKSVTVRGLSKAGDAIEIHADRADGPLLAKVKIDAGADWQIARASASQVPSGVHDLFVTHAGSGTVEVDWVRFE
jgi:hypothetical protein